MRRPLPVLSADQIGPRKGKPVWTAERLMLVAKLWNDGHTQADIGRMLGRSKENIRQGLQKHIRICCRLDLLPWD